MAALPLLKSGQAAQYPFKCSVKASVETVTFLDGSEQRYAMSRPQREWTMDLDLIDEQELAAIETFVKQQQGQIGKFQFTDPQDGVQYDNCSLSLGVLREDYSGPGRAKTVLVIRENLT